MYTYSAASRKTALYHRLEGGVVDFAHHGTRPDQLFGTLDAVGADGKHLLLAFGDIADRDHARGLGGLEALVRPGHHFGDVSVGSGCLQDEGDIAARTVTPEPAMFAVERGFEFA